MGGKEPNWDALALHAWVYETRCAAVKLLFNIPLPPKP